MNLEWIAAEYPAAGAGARAARPAPRGREYVVWRRPDQLITTIAAHAQPFIEACRCRHRPVRRTVMPKMVLTSEFLSISGTDLSTYTSKAEVAVEVEGEGRHHLRLCRCSSGASS